MKPKIFSRWILIVMLAGTLGCFADPSSGIVVDQTGSVYFTDVLHNTIWKVDTNGKLTAFIKDRHSHRLVGDANGNVYGEHLEYVSGNDSWRSHLWKASPAGELAYVTQPAAGFPAGLLLDGDGNRYELGGSGVVKKTSSLILRRAPDGSVTTLAGSGWGWADGVGGKALFGRIGGMAFGPDGALYVTDDAGVRRVTLDGNVTTVARELPELISDLKAQAFGDRSLLYGLAVDGELNVYVASYGSRRVAKISPRGEVLKIWASESGWAPSGVALKGGSIYVLEYRDLLAGADGLGPRVRRLSADGSGVTLGTVGEVRKAGQILPGWVSWSVAGIGLVAIAVTLLWMRVTRRKESET